jgi:hypothetical protein
MTADGDPDPITKQFADRYPWVGWVLLIVGCVAGAIGVGTCVSGCGGAPAPANIGGAECVTHRTALQLACVDTYEAGADIDRCRATVKSAVNCIDLDGGK